MPALRPGLNLRARGCRQLVLEDHRELQGTAVGTEYAEDEATFSCIQDSSLRVVPQIQPIHDGEQPKRGVLEVHLPLIISDTGLAVLGLPRIDDQATNGLALGDYEAV